MAARIDGQLAYYATFRAFAVHLPVRNFLRFAEGLAAVLRAYYMQFSVRPKRRLLLENRTSSWLGKSKHNYKRAVRKNRARADTLDVSAFRILRVNRSQKTLSIVERTEHLHAEAASGSRDAFNRALSDYVHSPGIPAVC